LRDAVYYVTEERGWETMSCWILKSGDSSLIRYTVKKSLRNITDIVGNSEGIWCKVI